MGRYVKDIRLDQPIDVVSMVMDDFVYHNRFSRADWNGEMVYYLKDRRNRERYLEWHYADGVLHMEAWLKSVFGNETDLNGPGGGASRREYRRALEELLETLKRQSPSSLAGGHIGSDPLHHEGVHGQNHEVWKNDTRWQQGTGKDTATASGRTSDASVHNRNREGDSFRSGGRVRDNVSIICALCALFAAWAFPVCAVFFAGIALSLGRGASRYRIARWIAVFAIVLVVLEIILGVIGGLMFHYMRGIL